MKALVLGGTGLIGGAVVRELLGRGHEVLALARSAASKAHVKAAGACPLDGDIRAPQQWVEALDRVDAVVHAAATFTDDMGDVDRVLVETLLSRMRSNERHGAFVYTGGCWLYGATGDRVADEQTPLDPPPEFAWMVEQRRAVLAAPGLRGMIIHPAMVYDGLGGALARFVDDARHRGRVRVVGGEATRWPLVHTDDLALVYVAMLEHGAAGAEYNAATIAGMSVGQIARAVARRYGSEEEPVIQTVEDVVAELGGWARGYAIDQQMSGAKARRELGWAPAHTDFLADLATAD